MALLVTSSVQIARFANALYGVKLGSVTNAAVLEDISVVGSSNAFNSYYSSSFGSMTNAAVATTILTNLGLADNAAAQAYVEGQLNAAGSAKGAAVLSMLNAFSNLTSDETFGAAATAWNAKVSTAISYTASNAADVTTDFSAPVTSQTFTLTTSTDKGVAFTGGAGDDQFDGFQSTASTFQAGDVLDGGAGNDTLSITLRADPEDVATVTLKNIETVVANVQATDATGGQLDAAAWTGVTTLSNAGSTAGSLLSVSGLALTTTVYASGNTDVTLDYRGDLTGSADTVSVQLAKFGTGTAQTLSGTGEVILAAGVDAVNVSLAGTSFVSIDGDNIKTITLTGDGAATVLTNDAITRFDASALVGTNAFTFSGSATTLVATGGAGNDTFTFITGGLSNADVIEGGAGTDTIRATLGNGTSAPALTGFETGRFLFTTTVNNKLDLASNTTGWNGITVSGSAAGTDVELMNVYAAASGLTLTLDDSTLTDVTLDSVTGSSVTVNVGSASGAVGIGSLEVTDVTTLTVISVASAAETIALVSDGNSQTRTLTIGNGASGSLTVSNIAASAVQTVVLGTSGSGGLTVSDGLRNATAISSLTIRAEGSDAADLVLSTKLFSGSGAASLDTISVTANSGADIAIANMALQTDGTAAAASAGRLNSVEVTIFADSDSQVDSDGIGGDIDISGMGANITLNLTVAQSGDIILGDVLMDGTGVGSVTVNAVAATAGAITIDDVSGSAIPFTLGTANFASAATLSVGDILVTGGAISLGTITLGTAASATLGAFGGSSLAALTVAASDNTEFTIGAVTATSKMGALTVNLGTAASATFGGFHVGTSGQAVSITLASAVDVNGNTGGAFYSAGKSISSVNVAVGTAATANFGSIGASSIGAVDISAATGGSAEFKLIQGSAGSTTGGSIGSMNFSGAGSFLITDAHASDEGAIGSVSVTLTTGDASATFTVLGTAENTIDTITVNVATGSDVTFTKIEATSLNTLTIAGAGDVTFAVSGTTFRTADFSGASGTVTADLTGVLNAVVVNAGHGTNVIISGSGNDTINLKTASGTDTIRFLGTAAASDTIANFQSGTDVISFGATGLAIISGSGTASTAQAAVDIMVLGSGGTALVGDNIVVVAGTAYASVTAMAAGLASGGANAVVLGASAAAAGNLVVAWSDGTSSYVSLLNISNSENSFLGTAADVVTLATLSGVTPGALVAANFAFTTV